MPLDKIKFEYNEPQACTLKHPSGKIVSGRFGEQVYFSLADGRCMYLDLEVAQKLNILEPQAGETIMICKRTSKVWDVWLSPETEKMRAAKDGGSLAQSLMASVTQANENRYATLRVPVLVNGTGTKGTPERAISAPAPVAVNGFSKDHSNSGNSNTRGTLADEAAMLVDAFAKVLDYSLSTYQGRVKPDDVRSLLLSAYIGRQKTGGAHV